MGRREIEGELLPKTPHSIQGRVATMIMAYLKCKDVVQLSVKCSKRRALRTDFPQGAKRFDAAKDDDDVIARNR